jgi:hypothetical protein
LEINGTCQLLVYADDINLLDKNINTTNRNKEILLDAREKVGLEVNAEKLSMHMSRHQNAGQ